MDLERAISDILKNSSNRGYLQQFIEDKMFVVELIQTNSDAGNNALKILLENGCDPNLWSKSWSKDALPLKRKLTFK